MAVCILKSAPNTFVIGISFTFIMNAFALQSILPCSHAVFEIQSTSTHINQTSFLFHVRFALRNVDDRPAIDKKLDCGMVKTPKENCHR